MMSLTRDLPSPNLDFSPDGLNQALTSFRSDPNNPRSPVVGSYVRELATSPRTVITHLLQLTPAQRALLDATSDAELQADLQPLVEALQAGRTVRVTNIEQLAPGAASLQQAPTKSQIVITIGRGRCKITITIDL